MIENWSVPTLVSGVTIIIAAFFVYWSWLIWNAKSEDNTEEKNQDNIDSSNLK